MWFYFIAPDRPNILKADSKNKKAIKIFFFIVPSPRLLKNGSRKNWEPKNQVTVALERYEILKQNFKRSIEGILGTLQLLNTNT